MSGRFASVAERAGPFGLAGRMQALWRGTARSRAFELVPPRSMEPRIVEIVGLAGAGKTTFLRQLLAARRNPSFWAPLDELAVPPDRSLLRTGRADARMLALLADRLDRLRTEGDEATRLRDAYLACARFFDALFLGNARPLCHAVVDEGFFYAARRGIAARAAEDPDFLAGIGRGHALVHIACEPAEALENLRRRAAEGGKVPLSLRSADAAAIAAAVEEDARDLAALVAAARRAGLPVLELPTRGAAATNVARFEATFG